MQIICSYYYSMNSECPHVLRKRAIAIAFQGSVHRKSSAHTIIGNVTFEYQSQVCKICTASAFSKFVGLCLCVG